jgi:hypothetical protein
VDDVGGGLMQQHNPLLYQTTTNIIHSSIKSSTTQSTPLSNHQQHNPLLYQTINNIIHSTIKPPPTQSTPLSNQQQHNPLLYQTFDRGVDYVGGGLIEEWIVLLMI